MSEIMVRERFLRSGKKVYEYTPLKIEYKDA